MKHWSPDLKAAVPLDGMPQRQRKQARTELGSIAAPWVRPRHNGEAQARGIRFALVTALCLVAAIAAVTLIAAPDPLEEMAIHP